MTIPNNEACPLKAHPASSALVRRENLCCDAKGEIASGSNREDQSTEAQRRDGAVRHGSPRPAIADASMLAFGVAFDVTAFGDALTEVIPLGLRGTLAAAGQHGRMRLDCKLPAFLCEICRDRMGKLRRGEGDDRCKRRGHAERLR